MDKSEEVATYHYNLGVQYEREGKLDDAKREYQYSVRCDSHFAYPHKGLGEIYQKKADIDMAIKEFAVAVQIDPNWHEAIAALANAFYERGEVHQAIHFQKKALKLDPDNPEYNTALGKMYIAHKKYDEAIEVLIRALEKNQKLYSARYNLGIAYAKRGMNDINISLDHWKEAIKINDDDSILHRNLGIIYYMKGMIEEAVESFEKTLELDSTDKVAHRFLKLSERFRKEERKK